MLSLRPERFWRQVVSTQRKLRPMDWWISPFWRQTPTNWTRPSTIGRIKTELSSSSSYPSASDCRSRFNRVIITATNVNIRWYPSPDSSRCFANRHFIHSVATTWRSNGRRKWHRFGQTKGPDTSAHFDRPSDYCLGLFHSRRQPFYRRVLVQFIKQRHAVDSIVIMIPSQLGYKIFFVKWMHRF